MAEHRGFRELQYRFAAHIRDPDTHPAPAGIEDRRMAIYRELFFNNACSLLASTYPVLSKILGEQRWRRLIRDYFATHVSHTPLFPEVPGELLDYLQNERGIRDGDPPFMLELAHYEWAELAVAIQEETPDPERYDPDGDLLQGIPVLSPLAWPLAYSFPVHRIGPDFQPAEPGEQPTFLVVYRRLDDEVGFLEINAVTARLLELLAEDGQDASGHELLARIAREIGHPNPATVIQGGRQILEDLHARDIVPGTAIG